jgi:Zn-dependent M28 family amino/carboxypeptidase
MESNTAYKIRRINGQNVGAILRGYERPDEVVLYTAHHDHLGVGIPDAKGDSIYNGAVDNASGTATVLMLAQAFAKMPYKPKRSIMFLTVTAEESGLLGAYYYSFNPAYPLAQTVANINIDCTNMFGPTYDITAVGPEYSELGNLLREKSTIENMELVPFPNIAGGIFFRSDQLPFAQGGVPALYLLSGNQYHEGYKEFVERKSAAYAGSYHQPSDNFDPEWVMEGTLQQARVAFRMAYKLANTNTWPQWVEGSEFESTRKVTDHLRK